MYKFYRFMQDFNCTFKYLYGSHTKQIMKQISKISSHARKGACLIFYSKVFYYLCSSVKPWRWSFETREVYLFRHCWDWFLYFIWVWDLLLLFLLSSFHLCCGWLVNESTCPTIYWLLDDQWPIESSFQRNFANI